MSHTTEIKSVVFTDMTALQAAVAELTAKGVKCSLVRDATPRAYYPNQPGLGLAPYVLKLEQCQYDVGFYHSTELKGYVARTDLFAGHVARVLGVTAQKGEPAEQAAMGKLYQTYAVHAATRKAVSQGMTVRRINGADGSIRLVLGGIQ